MQGGKPAFCFLALHFYFLNNASRQVVNRISLIEGFAHSTSIAANVHWLVL
jgi:hypothetical protein